MMLINPFLVSPSGPVAWTPAALSSLFGWYVADSLLNTVAGGNVTTIKDLSGKGHDAVGSAPLISSAIGGRSVIRTNTAGSQAFALNSSQGILNNKTGLCIGLMTLPSYTGTSLGQVFSTETPSSGFARFYLRYPGPTARRASVLGRRLDADSLQTVTTPADVTGTVALVAQADYSTATVQIRGNGTSLVSSAFQTAGSTSATDSGIASAFFGLRGGNGYAGDTGEIVLCNGPLTTADLEKLEGYLAWQWGQQASLPVGHPYKSAPPTV